MNTRKSRFTGILMALFLTIYSAGCSSASQQSDAVTTSPASTVSAAPVSAKLNQVEVSAPANESAAVNIALNGSTITADGSGAKAEGSTLTITAAGTYRLNGTLDNGQIIINAPDKAKVYLLLDGVSITSKTSAAIYCKAADKLIVTLADGSQNTLTDAESYTYADAAAEEPDAALFSKIDLEINGSGSLTVNGNFNNGIGTKDDLVIANGGITVNAANDGLRGRDSVSVLGGSLNVTAGGDGIQSNNDEDTTKGWITLEGGALTIAAGNDAIQAETTLTASGGTYNLVTGGGSTATPSDTTGSYKGLKAGTDLAISGGAFVIHSADDTVHANGNIAVSGGSLALSSGDDAVHADGDLTITGSATSIDISTSYEGLEAKTMTIADGIITLYATDDGINIAGGSDTGSGRFGRDSFSGANSAQWLKITGGTITVKAGSDGIDINGSGEMTGGDVNVTAATLGEGQTIDSDGGFTRTGGNLTESGGTTMGGGPGGGRGGMRG